MAKEASLIELLQGIKGEIEKIPGISATFVESEYCLCSYPTLEINVDEKITGISAYEICAKMRLKNIYLRDRYVNQGIVRIYSINMNKEIAEKIEKALIETINGARS